MKNSLAARQPFFVLVIGILGAALAAALIGAALGMPVQQLVFIGVLMAATGGLSLLVGVGLYQRRAIRLLKTLHISLLVNNVLAIVILLINVSVIMLSMIIADRDSVLITVLLIFTTILALVFGSLHSRTLIHELTEITQAVDHLADDRRSGVQLPIYGNDELTHLSGAFNRMAERLRQADHERDQIEQLRRDLIAWVSHDLRTPLTALRAMNEALMDRVIADPDQIALYSQDMNREIVALGHLIDDMFELSLLDTGQLTLAVEKSSLRDLLSSMLGSLKARAEQQQIRLEMVIQEPGIDPVWMAPDKIARVLSNLMDNAFQYAPPGGRIRIDARRADADVLISVFNSGLPLALHETQAVFAPFYRGDKARQDSPSPTRHAGLGLAIARRFVEAHGGQIWAEGIPDQGTMITFALPCR